MFPMKFSMPVRSNEKLRSLPTLAVAGKSPWPPTWLGAEPISKLAASQKRQFANPTNLTSRSRRELRRQKPKRKFFTTKLLSLEVCTSSVLKCTNQAASISSFLGAVEDKANPVRCNSTSPQRTSFSNPHMGNKRRNSIARPVQPAQLRIGSHFSTEHRQRSRTNITAQEKS